MGYFSEEDLKKKESSYDREDIEQNYVPKKELTKEELIHLVLQKDPSKRKEALNGLSLDDIRVLNKRLDDEMERRYFARYGNKEKARLYEYEDEQMEETDDLGYGR